MVFLVTGILLCVHFQMNKNVVTHMKRVATGLQNGDPNKDVLEFAESLAVNTEQSSTYAGNRQEFLDPRWPRRILYIWCGGDEFPFVNFLSLQSTIRSVNPSAVMFAYDNYPEVILSGETFKREMHNTWLKDIEENFPFFTRHHILESDNLCRNSTKRTVGDIIRFAVKHDFLGCLFVADRTVLVEPFVLQDVDVMIDYYDSESEQGIIYIPQHDDPSKSICRGDCPLLKLNDKIPDKCFQLEPYNMQKYAPNLDPELIMFNPTSLASQLRLILYGSRAYPELKPDSRHPAPNIAHYFWLGGGKMSFTFFLSVLSVIYLGEVDKVYFHGEAPPTGELWDKLLEMESGNRIQHVSWNRTYTVFEQPVRFIGNQADVIKSSVMWLQGGILMDPDLMFVRPPDPVHFHYEALVMAGGHPYMLNPSVAIAKPKSEFARLWLESEKKFVHNLYVWNCCYNLYKVWERKPQIAKMVRDFELLCWDGKCYPMWLDKNALVRRRSDLIKNVTDWKKEVVTVHFPKPTPYVSFKECAYKLQGLAGELGRMILRAAGLLRHNEGLVP